MAHFRLKYAAFAGRRVVEEWGVFTLDTEAKAFEAVCSSFVPSFVLFRMFWNNKQQLSISAKRQTTLPGDIFPPKHKQGCETGARRVCVFAYRLKDQRRLECVRLRWNEGIPHIRTPWWTHAIAFHWPSGEKGQLCTMYCGVLFGT